MQKNYRHAQHGVVRGSYNDLRSPERMLREKQAIKTVRWKATGFDENILTHA